MRRSPGLSAPPLDAGHSPAVVEATLFRWSPRDAVLVAAAAAHLAALAGLGAIALAAGLPGAPAFALAFGISIVWGSNTVAHIHIHTPLFRSRGLNEAFCVLLSLWMSIPQSIWRDRHLAHHAGDAPVKKSLLRGRALIEIAAVFALWITLLAAAPTFFLAAYLPGHALGLLLGRLVGHNEHRDELQPGAGVSHYGRLHNLLWLNDGYHVEHHRHPSEHWTRLPSRRVSGAAESSYSPLLRWLDPPRNAISPGASTTTRLLGALERLVLRSSLLQRLVIACHERAFRAVLAGRPLARICIIGGGLFPRTVMALRRIYPDARITVLDASPESLDKARAYLSAKGMERGVDLTLGRFEPTATIETDLLIAPLAFEGDRGTLYEAPRPSSLIVHDWLWRRRGHKTAIVSLFLLKRMNLIEPRSRA